LSLDSVPGLFFTEILTGLLLRPYNDSEKEPSERKPFVTVKINKIKNLGISELKLAELA
jgi:hypothetical protein